MKVGTGAADPTRTKALAPAPTVDAALAYGSQLQNLLLGFNQTKAGIMANSGQVKSDYENAAAQIRQQGIMQLSGTENASAGRGILGSSADVSQRLAVQGATSAALREAANLLTQGLAANKNATIAAQQTYETGKAAADAATNGFAGGLLGAPGGSKKPGGGGQGGGGQGGGGQSGGQNSGGNQADGILTGVAPKVAETVRQFVNWGDQKNVPPQMQRQVRNFIANDPDTAKEYFNQVWGDSAPAWVEEAVRQAMYKKIANLLAGGV
jgi:hypothetical protein